MRQWPSSIAAMSLPARRTRSSAAALYVSASASDVSTTHCDDMHESGIVVTADLFTWRNRHRPQGAAWNRSGSRAVAVGASQLQGTLP